MNEGQGSTSNRRVIRQGEWAKKEGRNENVKDTIKQITWFRQRGKEKEEKTPIPSDTHG